MIVLPLILSMAAGPANLDSLEGIYLELALRRNLSHAADSLDVASSRETRAGIRAGYGPQVQLTGGVSVGNDLDGTSVGGLNGTASVSQWLPTGGTLAAQVTETSSRVTDGKSRDTASAMVSFKQPLLQGFGPGAPLTYQVKQIEASTRLKFLAARGQGLVLLQQARNAYWNLAGAIATVQAQTEDSARWERLLAISRVQFRSGSASALDTLTAATNFAKAKVLLLQGRNAVREGSRSMATLADTDRVALPQPDSLPQPEAGAKFPAMDDLVKEAGKRAPDLAQTQVRIEALQSEVEYRRYSRLPGLNALVYGSNSLSNTSDRLVGARLDLDWSLPNGTERAKYRSALLDLRSVEIRRGAAEKELRHQIERILDSWASAREQLALTIDLAGLQRKRLAAAEIGYSAGSTSLMDLQSVRADWMNAVTSSWQAKAQAKALEADLETRTGIGPARQGWIWEER